METNSSEAVVVDRLRNGLSAWFDASPSTRSRARSFARLAALAIVPALFTNGMQWWCTAVNARKLEAERDRTVADIARMRQEMDEAGGRSLQAWLGVLERFKSDEERCMVLEAPLATSPDVRVRGWASEQIERLRCAATPPDSTTVTVPPPPQVGSWGSETRQASSRLECLHVDARKPAAFAPNALGQERAGYSDPANRALALEKCAADIKSRHASWFVNTRELQWECQCM